MFPPCLWKWVLHPSCFVCHFLALLSLPLTWIWWFHYLYVVCIFNYTRIPHWIILFFICILNRDNGIVWNACFDNLLFVLITVWDSFILTKVVVSFQLYVFHGITSSVYHFDENFWYILYTWESFFLELELLFVRCRCEMLQDIQFFFQSSVSAFYFCQWCINTHVFISPYHLLWLEFKNSKYDEFLNAVFP